eukprot:scaffold3690_cov113-Isochrysis_galbana.AAC.13
MRRRACAHAPASQSERGGVGQRQRGGLLAHTVHVHIRIRIQTSILKKSRIERETQKATIEIGTRGTRDTCDWRHTLRASARRERHTIDTLAHMGMTRRTRRAAWHEVMDGT